MRQYQTLADGNFLSPEGRTIPNAGGNRDYKAMIAFVDAELAEILPFVPQDPPYDMPSVQEQLDAILDAWPGQKPAALQAIAARVANRPGRQP